MNETILEKRVKINITKKNAFEDDLKTRHKEILFKFESFLQHVPAQIIINHFD